MSAAREGAAARETGGADLLWLGAAMMLLSLALPWVELRPNRLAAGEHLHPGGWAWAGTVLAALLALSARRPRFAVWGANVAVLAAFLALGQGTGAALQGQLPSARAAADSGWWLWTLGSAVGLWGAAFGRRLPWRWLWLPPALAYLLAGGLAHWSVWQEGQGEGERLLREAGQHLRLTLGGLGLALIIGAPLAVWCAGRPRAERAVLALAGSIQALPSLALLGLLIAPLAALSQLFPALRRLGVAGIGAAPALVALTLYALLPVVRGGVVALRGVSPGVLDAGRGMGMTGAQLFWRVELPLALPVWLAGLRQATALLIGVTAVAALIGAGGLGVYIFRGLNASATDLILLGALPASLLAIAADAAWRVLEGVLERRLHFPRGASAEEAGAGRTTP